jgi:hypothetical protein
VQLILISPKKFYLLFLNFASKKEFRSILLILLFPVMTHKAYCNVSYIQLWGNAKRKKFKNNQKNGLYSIDYLGKIH